MLSFNGPNNIFNLNLIIHIIKKLAHLGEPWTAFSIPGPLSTAQHSTHIATLHLQPVPFRDTLLDLWSE